MVISNLRHSYLRHSFIGLICFFLCANVVIAQGLDVVASVDKNPIVQGEPFTLTVTVNDDVPQSAWNPEQALSEFRVLNTRSARRTSVVDGVSSRTTSFVVTLQAPSTPGIVRIPPITINNTNSNAIELKILDAQAATDELEQRPAFIRTSIESSQVYVQQQFKLIARLYLSANLLSGNLVAPTLELAEVRQFGKDEESYEIINGKRYQVFQRTYLITPQRSGDFTIEGPMFDGQISRETSRSVFSSIAATQPVSTIAPPTQITVLPRPENWQGHWLPSELVSVSVEQMNPQAEIAVGQPITLKYRLTAIGVTPEQLPRVGISELNQASIYPEAPELNSTVRNGRVIAQRTETIAVIPRQKGELTIPAVNLTYFNTRLNRAETVTSEALTFTIKPAEGLQQDIAHTQSPVSPQISQPQDTPAQAADNRYFVLAIIFAGLWLATLTLWAWWWFRHRALKSAPSSAMLIDNPEHDHSWATLEQAAKHNNASGTDKALRHWLSARYSVSVTDLNQVADYYEHPPLTSQIEHLLRSRYAGKDISWQEGKALIRALKAAEKLRKQVGKKPAKSALPSLYPN